MAAMDYARVAPFYDWYITWTGDVAFFIEEARKADGSVLELLAGTGRLAVPLVEAGVDLTCVDSSPEMLEVLREKLTEKGLAANCIAEDVTRLNLDRKFDLIYIGFSSFSELLTVSDQQACLGRVLLHLSEEGRFICTMHNPRIRMENEGGRLRLRGRFATSDGTMLVWSITDPVAGDPVVSGYQFFEQYDPRGVLHEKKMVETRFRLVERGEFESLATANGFRIDALYGDMARSPFDAQVSASMIWVLSRA